MRWHGRCVMIENVLFAVIKWLQQQRYTLVDASSWIFHKPIERGMRTPKIAVRCQSSFVSVEQSVFNYRIATTIRIALFLQRGTDSFASAVHTTVNLSVCPSVCLSVTLRYCVKTRECRGMRFSPSGSPVSLAFWRQEWLMGDDPVEVKFECKEVDIPVNATELYIFRLITSEP